jgi:hypothetical protein
MSFFPSTVDVSFNNATPKAAVVAACAVRNRRGPPLRLIWDGNAIGTIGATAFLRTLSDSGCTACRVSLKGCSIDGGTHAETDDKPKPGDTSAAALAYVPPDPKHSFDWQEPSGEYTLNLDDPYDHTIARELCQLAEVNPGCFIDSLELFTPEEAQVHALVQLMYSCNSCTALMHLRSPTPYVITHIAMYALMSISSP